MSFDTWDPVRRRFRRIRRGFNRLWLNYLYQSLLSGHGRCLRYPVLAEPGACGGRCLHWRHRIGFICGSTFAFIPHSTAITAIIVYSLAVGTCVFLIVALDAEHPPAGGTALDVAITGFSVSVMVAVLTSSIMLSLAHRFCKKYLKDLT